MAEEQQQKKEEKPLPIFRADLEVYRGPDEPDGSPTYNIYDPVKAQYYKVSWAEASVLKVFRPGMTLSQLLEAVNQQSTLQVKREELEAFLQDAALKGLLSVPRSAEHLTHEVESRKQHPIMWLLHHYLYIRVPLLNPNAFLENTLPYVKWLCSPLMLLFYGIVSFIGLFFLAGRLDEYFYTFPYFFSFEGIFIYMGAILAVKFIHEFAHAYTATAYGVSVPSMGVAFIVLWPVLFTDVTDSWKLSKRSQRFMIAFAGVYAELIIGGISILCWVVTPDGPLHSMFFVLSSVTLASTLLVNLNPAMRFDGYYLLSDSWGIDNLQPRAFAVARWKLREWFLGLQMPSPEDPIYEKHYTGMVIYSVYTWIYRLILYTAIAALVYYHFTKSLGIILFVAEIVFFIISPFYSEFQRLSKLRPLLSINVRSMTLTAIIGLLFLWLALPLPHSEEFAAVTIPVDNQVLYAPEPGVIKEVLVKRGEKIQVGQPLLELASVDLNAQIADQYLLMKVIQSEIDIYSQDDDSQSLIPEKKAEYATAQAQLRGLVKKHTKNIIKAQLPGTIYELDQTLRPGLSIQRDQVLGSVADISQANVVFYVSEHFISSIKEGDEISFRLSNTFDWFGGRIEAVSPVRTQLLKHPSLASIYGGELAVMNEKEQLRMVDSLYQVTVSLFDPDLNLSFGKTGEVSMRIGWRSKLFHYSRSVLSLFWRESAF